MRGVLAVPARMLLAALAFAPLASGCGSQSGPLPHPTPAQLLASRPYTVRVPPGYSASKPAPLLLALHGAGSSGDGIEQYWQLAPATDASGILYVHPDAVSRGGSGALLWNAVPNPALPPFDVDYLTAIIDDISAKYSVDPKRIFVAGHSLGAFMAYRLACDRAGRIAAVVSLAGQVPTDPAQCAASAPVAVAEVHGDHDTVITYDRSGAGVSAADTVSVWAQIDSCTRSLANTGRALDLDDGLPGAETRIDAWSGCAGNAAAELWTIRGGEHNPSLIIPTWPDAVVAFLLAHPKQ